MLLLVLLLSLDGGVPKRCTVSCYRATSPMVCYYDVALVCPSGECVDSSEVVCKPRMTTLPWE